MKLTRTLGNQLPGVLPTPDPDLNRALQAVLDDGIELNSAIQAFADPPTTEQANALQDRVSDFVSTLGTLGWTYDRDGEIIDARVASRPSRSDHPAACVNQQFVVRMIRGGLNGPGSCLLHGGGRVQELDCCGARGGKRQAVRSYGLYCAASPAARVEWCGPDSTRWSGCGPR